MRLSNQQITEIKEALSSSLSSSNFKIYLVGSRVKDHLKGGDIDLLLIFESKENQNYARSQKLILINQLMKQPSIDDTKVDLILGTEDDLKSDPFISTLDETKVLI